MAVFLSLLYYYVVRYFGSSSSYSSLCLLPSAPPIIVVSPPAKVEVDVSYTFVINCTAMGIPTPEVIWRLNWGHVPDKCRQTSTPTAVGNREAIL